MPHLSVAILGSYRKHWTRIAQAAATFRHLGCEVLCPNGEPVNPGAEFVRLNTDQAMTEEAVVQSVMRAIDQADLVYFYNPEGYLGASAAVELGYCLAAGKRFYLLAEPADHGHRAYAAGRIASPEQAVDTVKHLRLPERLTARESLPALQRYVADMVEARGFSGELPRDVMLLMLEEVGELAKALRKAEGLKIDTAKLSSYGALGDEMADVLLYLIALANATGIDLATALRTKEEQNDRRVWT